MESVDENDAKFICCEGDISIWILLYSHKEEYFVNCKEEYFVNKCLSQTIFVKSSIVDA